jgi:sugar/nucleoside kinase (ribokinase family)
LAARFGAKTVLFGAVGEDDFGEVRSEFEHLKFDSSALYTLQFGLLINPDCQI